MVSGSYSHKTHDGRDEWCLISRRLRQYNRLQFGAYVECLIANVDNGIGDFNRGTPLLPWLLTHIAFGRPSSKGKTFSEENLSGSNPAEALFGAFHSPNTCLKYYAANPMLFGKTFCVRALLAMNCHVIRMIKRIRSNFCYTGG